MLAGLAVGAAGALAADSDSELLIGAASASEEGGGHEAVMNLVPTDEATHTATTSGAWSNAGIWDDGRPGDGARVHVPEGTTVTVDGEFGARLDWVRVDGTLRFATDTETHLRVDTIVTTEGSRFEIGTENDPVRADVTAQITFIDSGQIDENWDPERVSRGLLTMGTVRTKGRTTSPFHELAAGPTARDSSLDLAQAPTGWEVGDTVVVPSTTRDVVNDNTFNPKQAEFDVKDEERTIASVSGSTVELEASLAYDHVPPKQDLPIHAANLDRNIRLQSENDATKRRGHVMFMDQDVRFRDVGLYGLGRTDKSRSFTDPINGTTGDYYDGEPDPNLKARYSCHFHRTGIEESEGYPQAVDTSEQPGRVEGCVAWDSPGWGFVNHMSYAHFRNNVSYEVVGAHFVCEMGVEMGSFEHNIAIRSRGSGEIHSSWYDKERPEGDKGHKGAGFWMAGPGVALRDNVACGHHWAAFQYWSKTIPQKSLDAKRPFLHWQNYPKSETRNEYSLPTHHPGDDVLENPGFVCATDVSIPAFENNVAWGSGIGIRSYRHCMGNGGPDFAYPGLSHIVGFTAYNLSGEFTGSALSFQYSGNLRFDNLYLVRGDTDPARGATNHMPTSFSVTTIENSRIEGFDAGLGNTRGGPWNVYNCEFKNNGVDLITTTLEDAFRVENSSPSTFKHTDSEEVVTLESADARSGYRDVDGVFGTAADAVRRAYGPESATLTGNYVVESGDSTAWQGKYIGTDGDLSREDTHLLGDSRMLFTFEDLPAGTYDLWARIRTPVSDRITHRIGVHYWLDPPADDPLELTENSRKGGWSGANVGTVSTQFTWGKVTGGLEFDGTHDIALANKWNFEEVDALLLVRNGPDPLWPPAIEASNVDSGIVPSVSMTDQTNDGQSVTVASAANPEEFVIVVHKGSASGPKIGSTTVSGGRHSGITVELDGSLSAGEHTLVPMLHEAADSGHGPPIFRDGEMVTDSATVTVEDSGNCVVEHFAGEDGDVSDMELLRAIRQWREDESVGECGRQVRYTDLLELIARWRGT